MYKVYLLDSASSKELKTSAFNPFPIDKIVTTELIPMIIPIDVRNTLNL